MTTPGARVAPGRAVAVLVMCLLAVAALLALTHPALEPPSDLSSAGLREWLAERDGPAVAIGAVRLAAMGGASFLAALAAGHLVAGAIGVVSGWWSPARVVLRLTPRAGRRALGLALLASTATTTAAGAGSPPGATAIESPPPATAPAPPQTAPVGVDAPAPAAGQAPLLVRVGPSPNGPVLRRAPATSATPPTTTGPPTTSTPAATPPTTEPPATVPPATVPPTTSPPESVPPTTAPAVALPPTAAPPTTAAPSTPSVPPPVGEPPVAATPEPSAPSRTPAPATSAADAEVWVIQPGEHLWHVARETVAEHLDRDPGVRRVGTYWRRLIEANRDRLVDPDNPDLVYPGQEMVLPPFR